MRFFVSGPVSGKTDHNREEFKKAERLLQSQGRASCTPFAIPEPRLTEHTESDEAVWRYYMRHCIREICLCDGLYMLPGWQNSKGALIEHRLARELGLQILYAPVPDHD